MAELFEKYKQRHQFSEEELTINEYLELCKKDNSVYLGPAERMLKAIGEPEIIDTKNDQRLSRIHFNKIIKTYPAFKEFYGIEDVIEQIVGFFKHASQGLEERKQVLYLLGPVGSSKSSLAERLKQLMEFYPIYSIKDSPIHENPLGLFSVSDEDKKDLEEEYGIPRRYVPSCMSPWATKRLREYNGDITKFKVIKYNPSIQHQIAISKIEPGDDNNSDISTLVGKIDIRKLAEYAQDDADAYNYSGGLCKSNQGILEFVEMFKAPIKVLHPLLTATQERNFKGTEAISAMPFDGIILAHSNQQEWQTFSNDKKNEAFLDRVYIVRVPYCTRVSEEVEIYKKLLRHSSLSDKPCASQTLEILAQFSVMSRLKEPENSTLFSKMKIYDGENLKEVDPKAKSLQEYKDSAGITEGMEGISTRFAFKVLSKVFNYDNEEIAANPIHLLYVLEQEVIKAQFSKEQEEYYLDIIKSTLAKKYAEFIGDEIQKAYVESYYEYGQNIFEKYLMYADAWIQDADYRDPDTGESYDRESLNKELEKIEKPHIVNAKEFRHEIVGFSLRSEAKNKKKPSWDSYQKIKEVIEKRIFSNTEDLLPVISFSTKTNQDEEKKHHDFINRMEKRGYTKKQIKLIVDWFLRYRKHS